MRLSECVECSDFPCDGVDHERYIVPSINVIPENVSIVMISEAAPPDACDYYYAGGKALFEQTTLQAFKDAGAGVSSFQNVLDLGIYLTTAVKCGKIGPNPANPCTSNKNLAVVKPLVDSGLTRLGYGIKAGPIKECSLILEKELDLFPNVKAFMLMGDVAIKTVNYIAKRASEGRVIPAGSTYKIRGPEYFFRGARAFPSYVQAGPSFFIEKSKRKMIAEDIGVALGLLR